MIAFYWSLELFLWSLLFGLIWSQIISHWAVSILLHRHYTHQQFQVPKWYERIGLGMLMICCVDSPIGWVAIHRMHHEHADHKEDPHAPKHVGYWRVLFSNLKVREFPTRYVRDLFRNKDIVFCHKYWLHLLIICNIIAVIISPYFWLGFCAVPFVFAKIGFGLLNTVGHRTEGGADVPWLNFFIAGEGYHRTHHQNWKRIRLHKWDTAGFIAEKLFDKHNGLLRRVQQ